MLKIKRPDWFEGPVYRKIGTPYNLDKFWEEEIEPINKMLEAGVEVYLSTNKDEVTFAPQYAKDRVVISSNFKETAHKALLINIQPIKKETAEDILSELMADLIHHNAEDINIDDYYNRYKAMLGEIE